MKQDLQWTQNLDLLADNLLHLRFELCLDKPHWFRIGKEAYHALCRTMVEALRGSANLAITGSRRPKDRRHHYHIGNAPWKMIEKRSVANCSRAWRFSEPILQDPPTEPSDADGLTDENLVGFFDLLAMIQAECFMSRLTEAKPVAVPDEEMRSLEWLHNAIRNEFEHFMPKLYGANFNDLAGAASISLDVADRLFHESGNIMPLDRYAGVLPTLAITKALLLSVCVAAGMAPTAYTG